MDDGHPNSEKDDTIRASVTRIASNWDLIAQGFQLHYVFGK